MIVLILGILSPSSIRANTNEAKLDAVLVIDASISMQTNDPNKLGLEAVKMFVDMLGMTDNQVGIVTYGKSVGKVYPMTYVRSQEDKEKIKSFVDQIERNLNFTDITSGLLEATQLLEGRKTSSNNPLIVVFTDGNNDVNGLKGRTETDIEKELNSIIDTSNKENYPIYTVGLNERGELNEQYLADISNRTNGKAFIARKPSELPGILTQIFADHMDLKVMPLQGLTGTGAFEEVTINIPNANVLEANISATSTQPIELKLIDPTGVEQTIPSSSITRHTSKTYDMLKIVKPKEGDWKLLVKGIKGDAIQIDLLYNYEMGVTLSPLAKTSYGKGDTLKTEAFLALNGKPVDDESLYKNAQAKLVLTEVKSGTEVILQMENTKQGFAADYALKEEGEYEVKVIVDDTTFKRESETLTFKVEGSALPNVPNTSRPVPEQDKSPIMLYIIGGLVLLLVVGGGAVVYAATKKSQTPLVGQLVIEVRDNTSGKLGVPQYKKLHLFKGKVDLHTLLQLAPEFKETEKIVFKNASGDKVFLYNASPYIIEKAGRAVQAKEGLELKKNDKIIINVVDSGQTVQIEYLL